MFNMFKKKESESVKSENIISTQKPIVDKDLTANEMSEELIAVITAAIAAIEGRGIVGTDGFVVRKISRVHGSKTSWSDAGLMECIYSRK